MLVKMLWEIILQASVWSNETRMHVRCQNSRHQTLTSIFFFDHHVLIWIRWTKCVHFNLTRENLVPNQLFYILPSNSLVTALVLGECWFSDNITSLFLWFNLLIFTLIHNYVNRQQISVSYPNASVWLSCLYIVIFFQILIVQCRPHCSLRMMSLLVISWAKNEFLAQSLQHNDVNVFSFISKLKACFKKCDCQVTSWIHGYNQIRTIIFYILTRQEAFHKRPVPGQLPWENKAGKYLV